MGKCNTNMKTACVRIPEELTRKLDYYCSINDVAKSDAIRRAIRDYLASHQTQG